jgi:guanine deaminase
MDRFMEIAYEEALLGISKKHGGPFGALIVRNNEVVAQGHNEVLLRQDPTAHAEIVVIRAACEQLNTVNLSDCVLYATAKPCPMCKGAIQWSRIQKVVFSGDYKDTERLSFDDLQFSTSFGSEEEHCLQIDQEHFKTLIDAFAAYKEEIKY